MVRTLWTQREGGSSELKHGWGAAKSLHGVPRPRHVSSERDRLQYCRSAYSMLTCFATFQDAKRNGCDS